MSQGLIIPCYNEARRLKVDQIEMLLRDSSDLHILLVDDGSSDGTAELLERVAKNHARVKTLILPKNVGKAEAVRLGLLKFLDLGTFQWLGYADADFATPAQEILRLMKFARESSAAAILGSRIMILGARIHRRPLRHYLGRVFATFASLALRLPVYDTQCGAKMFQCTPSLKKSLDRPFLSKWVFDVELIGRLAAQLQSPQDEIIEVPLKAWRDIDGSTLKMSAMLKAAFDIFRIGIRVRCGSL